MLVFSLDHLSWHRVGLYTGTKCTLETLNYSTWSCQNCTSWSLPPTWRSCPLQLQRGCAVLRLLILIHFEGEWCECEVFGGVWRHQPTFAIRWHWDSKAWIISLELWSRVWTWSLRVLLGVPSLGWLLHRTGFVEIWSFELKCLLFSCRSPIHHSIDWARYTWQEKLLIKTFSTLKCVSSTSLGRRSYQSLECLISILFRRDLAGDGRPYYGPCRSWCLSFGRCWTVTGWDCF